MPPLPPLGDGNVFDGLGIMPPLPPLGDGNVLDGLGMVPLPPVGEGINGVGVGS